MDYCGILLKVCIVPFCVLHLFEVLNTAYQKTTLSIPKMQYVKRLIYLILV